MASLQICIGSVTLQTAAAALREDGTAWNEQFLVELEPRAATESPCEAALCDIWLADALRTRDKVGTSMPAIFHIIWSSEFHL